MPHETAIEEEIAAEIQQEKTGANVASVELTLVRTKRAPLLAMHA